MRPLKNMKTQKEKIYTYQILLLSDEWNNDTKKNNNHVKVRQKSTKKKRE